MRSSKQPAALDTDTDDFPHRGRPSPWTKPLYSYDTLLQCSQWVPFHLLLSSSYGTWLHLVRKYLFVYLLDDLLL